MMFGLDAARSGAATVLSTRTRSSVRRGMGRKNPRFVSRSRRKSNRLRRPLVGLAQPLLLLTVQERVSFGQNIRDALSEG